MKKTLIVVLALVILCSFASCAKGTKENAKAADSKVFGSDFDPKTADVASQYYYCFGYYQAKEYKQYYPEIDYDALAAGILAQKDESFPFTEENVQQIVTAYQSKLNEKAGAQANENLQKAEAFLAENKNKEGVVETESGLQYQVIIKGKGEKPSKTSTVTVDYELSTTEGKVIESTLASGAPASFSLEQVIPGFAEGILLMETGSTYKLFIHPNLGYGAQGAGSIGPNQVLVFEVSLIAFK